jgi:hypothetical protein
MALLNERKRKDYVLVGVHVPPRVHNYMTLHIVAKGTTKCKIIKELIDKWIADNKPKCSETTLIKEIIQRVNVQWKVKKGKGFNFTEYKTGVRKELIMTGLKEEYINVILAEIKL